MKVKSADIKIKWEQFHQSDANTIYWNTAIQRY